LQLKSFAKKSIFAIYPMQRVTFYILYPFIYLFSLLPFWALYGVSDLFYLLLKVTGYRKAVVIKNLRHSFPEKSDREVAVLGKAYCRYLCDLTLETLKTLNMSEKQTLQRCVFHNQPWLTRFSEEKKSIIIVMGHYGNWEWAGPSFTLSTGFQLVVIYRPLSHPYFEKMTAGMRTRFGTRITPVEKTLRDMVANQKELTATAFIADQATTSKNAFYWTTFLHQDTAVFTGPEKLARRFNYPVVFMNVKRVRRGYYEVTPELLFENPAATTDNEISETFIKRLEREIVLDPVPWLWSHKRWKKKRPVG
jgi:Kdo2-lipid IVA lauroyltransferase/acyltransferase